MTIASPTRPEHVLGLDVPMHDSLSVRVPQPAGGVAEQAHTTLEVSLMEQDVQRAGALDQVVDEERRAAVHTGVEDPDHVWVRETRGRFALAEEALSAGPFQR